MNKVILFVVLLFSLGLLLFGIVFITSSQLNKSSPIVVVEKIKELNKLETIQYSAEKIIEIEKDTKGLPKILVGDKILYIAYGEVTAGIDLSKINETNIQKTDNGVVITLPPAEIFSVRLDSDKSYVYDRKTGLLTQGEINLQQQAQIKAEVSMRKAACQNGILEQAAINAKKNIETLLSKTNQPVTITVQPSSSCK